MTGPYPKGELSSGKSVRFTDWSGMKVGKNYRVTKTFIDGDRSAIRAGTTWTFLGHYFSGFGGIMGMVVSLDGQQEWSIPFRFEEKEDSELVDNLVSYIEKVNDPNAL